MVREGVPEGERTNGRDALVRSQRLAGSRWNPGVDCVTGLPRTLVTSGWGSPASRSFAADALPCSLVLQATSSFTSSEYEW